MELTGYLQFVAALALVLALIGALTWLIKRSGVAGSLMPAATRKGEARRLGVVEVLPLDPRRKLVLVRCDDREHLLLLHQGPAPDLVVAATAAPQAVPDFDEALERAR
ncbi:Flagellar biogenesis protein FliO [Tistlia consotensis]|uniref:Flagellar protein FliO/FliZ n=1 Tax=Tistlia consotensis USBA 355 TaxID=560819 RepID=A0A1Y6CQF3_9PROT|nr:flagellar biosynthetic protein FliO [Tistlia consotensis]SMF68118.1 flagellar protein FliO/FliZ [Tistlia consotensis USBA 355]SNR99046.1 Flagellar biogenesis protein FliO [Tistlia consotensis]